MPRPPTANEKTGDWFAVFDKIKVEMTTDAMREMVKLATPEAGMASIQLGMGMAKIVAANDRAAAIAAAMLVQSGVSRPVIDIEEPE